MYRIAWSIVRHQRAVYGESLWKIAIVLVGLLLASNVLADELPDNEFKKRFYAGAGLGASYLEPDASDIPFRVIDRVDQAFTVFLGADLSQRFSADLRFSDLGFAGLSGSHEVEYSLFSVSAVVYGLNEKARRQQRLGLSAFGRLGIAKMNNTSDIVFIRENDYSLMFGFGLEYGFERGLAVRAEAISFEVDAQFAGLSLLYRFGTKSPQRPSVVPPQAPPEPVAAPPIVEEVPVVEQPIVEPPVVVEPVPLPTFVMFFAHDSSSLDARSQVETARLAQFLKHNTAATVVLTGFASKPGSEVYNRHLAARRVDRIINALRDESIAQERLIRRVHGETDQFGLLSGEERLDRRVGIDILH